MNTRPIRHLAALIILASCSGVFAVDPPNKPAAQPRTGQTRTFGNQTTTRWSDGATTTTRPFGTGSTTTERSKDGKVNTGQTRTFGNQTTTRWSDEATTTTRPFGTGSSTVEKPGKNGTFPKQH